MISELEREQDAMDRNVNIIVGQNGEKSVLIHEIRFKGKTKEDYFQPFSGRVCRI